MVLLLQLNGDLPEFFPGHERRLYVLTCRRKTCRRKEGSVRALRGVRITEVASKDKRKENKSEPKSESPLAKPAPQLGNTLFGVKPSSNPTSANPFSTSNSSSVPGNPFSTSSFTTPSNPFATVRLDPSELAAKPPQTPPTGTDLPKTFASALSLNNPNLDHHHLPNPGLKNPTSHRHIHFTTSQTQTTKSSTKSTSLPFRPKLWI
jgi:pre-rRNA-processing protein TSR4